MGKVLQKWWLFSLNTLDLPSAYLNTKYLHFNGFKKKKKRSYRGFLFSIEPYL